MKKLIASSAAALLAATAFISPAFAGHGDPGGPLGTGGHGEPIDTHEVAPAKQGVEVAHTTCVVAGKVTTTPTAPQPPYQLNDVTHGEYDFVDTDLQCVGLKGGTYAVDANGSTDGPCQLETKGTKHADDYSSLPKPFQCLKDEDLDDNGDAEVDWEHGRTTVSAWSNSFEFSGGSGGVNANKGDISAGNSSGWVKFVRVGTQVEAWGCFDNGTLQRDCFDAVLVFTPESDGGGGFNDNRYDLTGSVVVGLT